MLKPEKQQITEKKTFKMGIQIFQNAPKHHLKWHVEIVITSYIEEIDL